MKFMVFFFIFALLATPLCAGEQRDESKKTYYRIKSIQSIKKENITRQTLDYSCGAASLSTILNNYFNDNQFSEQILLKDIILRLDNEDIVSRVKDGFSMLDLKLLAKRIGYEADGVTLPYDAIYKLRGPIIILLHKNRIKHFVALKGAKSGKAYISDPISGNYKINEHDLKNSGAAKP